MSKEEFQQVVQTHGKDILRFCRMTTGSKETGDELYQDTMLKLLEKLEKLDSTQNIKSYAISISILLWKNKKRKFARRFRIIPEQSMTEWEEEFNSVDCQNNTLEEEVIKQEEIRKVQDCVANLPEKYRICIHLFYSAQLSIREIAQTLQVPEGTVKTRIHKAKKLLKIELEE